ncbi:hypothetical protein EDD21DRAFT_156841 [Dissophora ornata]|nr:hypothetical protein EDD21DRAFT_156841 [Dissophora ornata]
MNDQRDETFEALEGIKDRKIRLMFATLVEHLPIDKESRIAEETFVATLHCTHTLGNVEGKRQDLHSFTLCVRLRKIRACAPDRPDIIAKVGERELLLGEVMGPCQETHRAKNDLGPVLACTIWQVSPGGQSLRTVGADHSYRGRLYEVDDQGPRNVSSWNV